MENSWVWSNNSFSNIFENKRQKKLNFTNQKYTLPLDHSHIYEKCCTVNNTVIVFTAVKLLLCLRHVRPLYSQQEAELGEMWNKSFGFHMCSVLLILCRHELSSSFHSFRHAEWSGPDKSASLAASAFSYSASSHWLPVFVL